jgi:hypothetical protein
MTKIIKIYQVNNRRSFAGQLGAAAPRRVTITGAAQLNVPLLTVEGAEQFLQDVFQNEDGWRIINFDFAQKGSMSLNGKRQFSINVEVDAPGEYSNADHLNEFIARLNSYALNYGIGSTKAVSDISVTITGADIDGQVRTNSAGNQNLKQIKDDNDKESNDFLSLFATALGVSIPVAAVGGGLLLILMLRR